MIYAWLTILILFNACWLAMVPFTLPGNWLMVISTCLFAWWKWDDSVFGWPLLIAVTILALIAELIEFFAGIGGAKKAGAGWMGAIAAIGGALLGAIVGTGFMPIFGTVLGACLGAGIATWIVERATGKEHKLSVRSGVGAGKGVLVGTLSKFAIGCLIWLLVAIAAFWP